MAILFVAALCAIVIMRKSQTAVCIKEICFNVEIARTAEEKLRGLKNREILPKDEGMLFIYSEEKQRNFWMKDVLIPLDIIWINKDKEIVFIEENAQPCKNNCPVVASDKKAKYVLEVKGGICQDIGIRVGDKINIY